MNILFIDHYFSQDIQEMSAAGGNHVIRIVPFSYFYHAARRRFPPSVFTGLENYYAPEIASARAQWRVEARRLVHRLYLSFPFDAIISPSDTFFYIRDVVTAAQELGTPFIVLQKETTIAPQTMAKHAQNIGRFFPFIGDLMLVCSERHKQFWLETGADSSKIIVTGQPRFDLYAHPERRQRWSELGLRVRHDRPVLLFFSYDLGAYSPEGEMVAQTWKELRTQTETALFRLAQEGYTVLIKPHPQQNQLGEARRLGLQCGDLWGDSVQLLDPELDARLLILNSDIVIGFQTTALFEAMAADKRVILTFWSEPAHRYADDLIPFHRACDTVECVTSPEELMQAVRQSKAPVTLSETRARRRKFFEEYLGPFDGNASCRAWLEIEKITTPRPFTPLRRELDAQAESFCRREGPRMAVSAIALHILARLVPIFYPVWRVARRMLGRGSAEMPPATKFRENLQARARFLQWRARDCENVIARKQRVS